MFARNRSIPETSMLRMMRQHQADALTGISGIERFLAKIFESNPLNAKIFVLFDMESREISSSEC